MKSPKRKVRGTPLEAAGRRVPWWLTRFLSRPPAARGELTSDLAGIAERVRKARGEPPPAAEPEPRAPAQP